ncbi:hypothetical protein IWQ60_000588 [Tieghemiomyces parasiticus]|uniref:Uncharacterized protein n=1 Tax=Tieghemiomyces parasiticus TaxID=78921 RepID=A0A9W8AFL4_9FUNG|nr:hypothetical protein IWQ60_000588 [Tieghemiomyces parasiticus]
MFEQLRTSLAGRFGIGNQYTPMRVASRPDYAELPGHSEVDELSGLLEETLDGLGVKSNLSRRRSIYGGLRKPKSLSALKSAAADGPVKPTAHAKAIGKIGKSPLAQNTVMSTINGDGTASKGKTDTSGSQKQKRKTSLRQYLNQTDNYVVVAELPNRVQYTHQQRSLSNVSAASDTATVLNAAEPHRSAFEIPRRVRLPADSRSGTAPLNYPYSTEDDEEEEEDVTTGFLQSSSHGETCRLLSSSSPTTPGGADCSQAVQSPTAGQRGFSTSNPFVKRFTSATGKFTTTTTKSFRGQLSTADLGAEAATCPEAMLAAQRAYSQALKHTNDSQTALKAAAAAATAALIMSRQSSITSTTTAATATSRNPKPLPSIPATKLGTETNSRGGGLASQSPSTALYSHRTKSDYNLVVASECSAVKEALLSSY